MAGKAILTCKPNSHLFQERTLVLEHQPVKIGRSVARARPSPNNAIFDCKVLSRNHALFWYHQGKFFLQDTKSSNGTFVNAQRISRSGEESLPTEVCSGDTVQFGVDVIENTRKDESTIRGSQLDGEDETVSDGEPQTSGEIESLSPGQFIEEVSQQVSLMTDQVTQIHQGLVNTPVQLRAAEYISQINEPTPKITHGCIIANLKLILPDGKEAKASQSSSVISLNSIPVEDLYELHQYIQQATHREHMLETKLVALQEVLNGIKDAADQGWKALIAEDRLLTRVEALENQLQAYSKNFGEDKLKEELVKLHEEKNQYQCTAKEFLKKVLDEKLEAVQKCQEVKRSLVYVEAAYSNLTDEMGKSRASIQELAHKLSVQLVKNEDIEIKLQDIETKHKETVERLERRNKELEIMLVLHHEAEESLEKQLTDLRSAENIANEKATAYEIQLKALNDFSDKEVIDYTDEKGDANYKEEHKLITPLLLEENKDIEVHELLTGGKPRNSSRRRGGSPKEMKGLFKGPSRSPVAQLDLLQAEQRARLPQYIEDQKASSSDEESLVSQTLQLVPLKESVMEISHSDSFDFDKAIENGKGTLNGEIKDNNEASDNESDICDAKGNEIELNDSDKSCELADTIYKENFDTIKSENCVLAQEKFDKTHKIFEENSVITQVLKEQNKMINQFKIENFEPVDIFQTSQNKKNQEQDENLLRRQLLEAQQSAKQSRNEQAQLMDRIITLTAELESKNLSDDNKIREKLFETQQECNKLQNTISTLESELLSLKEEHSKIEGERIWLQQKLDNYKVDRNAQTNISEKQYEDLTLKVSKLQEELLIVGSKYMTCNEERTKISKELSNLRLDYQAISHQPYFNLLFALPCIVLILAITIVFYPTLSQIMGTAEHADDQQKS